MILQIFRLTTDQTKVQGDVQKFYTRLLVRGHPRNIILPIIRQAIKKVTDTSLTHIVSPPITNNLQDALLLHLPYHPCDPKPTEIQKIFRRWIYTGIGQQPIPLPNIKNHLGHQLGFNRLIIAYSRPRNIGNIMSPRRFDVTPGPTVSEYARIHREHHEHI